MLEGKERRCTALSLVLYGDFIPITPYSTTSIQQDCWMIDDEALRDGVQEVSQKGLFLRTAPIPEGTLVDIGQGSRGGAPTVGGDARKVPEEGEGERRSLFLAPIPLPTVPPKQPTDARAKGVVEEGAVFMRSDSPSEEWVVA